MRISLKVIAWAWVVLFIILGGLFYNGYRRLNPEAVIATLKQQVEKNYPRSELSVGSVKYGYFIDFNIQLENLILKRDGKKLGIVKEVELKVPWWLLLFKKGNAQINLSELTIFLDQSAQGSLSKISNDSLSKSRVTVELPNFLTDAKYTLRAKEISIKDVNESRTYLHLSKLLVREFQYGKNSAFELNIPIDINHKNTKYKSELWLFGDLTPNLMNWKLNYRGEFKAADVAEKFQIEDIVINGTASFRPSKFEVSSHLNLAIDKESVGNGSILAGNDELSVIFNFTNLPLHFLSLLDEEIKNPYIDKYQGEVEGYLKISKDHENTLSLNGKLKFDSAFSFDEQNKIDGKWQYSFLDSKWETSFISPKGEVIFFRRAFFDYLQKRTIQYNEELGFNGINSTLAFENLKNLEEIINLENAHYFSSKMTFKDCTVGDSKIDGQIKYGNSPDSKYYLAELKTNDGNFNFNYQLKDKNQFIEATFNKFLFGSYLKIFLPYYLVDGSKIDGKIQGHWSDLWYQGKWLVQLNQSELNNPSGLLNDLNKKIWNVFEIGVDSINNQTWNFEIKKNGMSNLNFALNNTEAPKITGNLLSDKKVKSYLVLNYPKNKKWKPVKKEVKTLFWEKEGNE
ncbi:MAG: hypothetical protein AB7I27_07790 [Bacteriovoracaceae bacterium]